MKRRSEAGQAIVETAIVLSLLLLIMVGVIEFTLVLYDQAVLTNACREGARAGIVSQAPRRTDGEITTIVNNYCSNRLISFAAASPVVTVTRTGTAPFTINDELTVSVNYNYTYLVLPNFGVEGDQLPLTARAVMRFE